MQEILIGIVGAGTVGGGVVKILHNRIRKLREETGLPIRLARIADKDQARLAQLPVADAVCTAESKDVLNDPAIQIVVELVGGTTFAKEVVLTALGRKKHVVTANKALLAEHGPEIFETAARENVSVYFEAAVGGGMPIIKAIRESLVANEIFSVKTIINGTCNYILSKMSQEKLSFADALKEAQVKGFAEVDPTLDVGGGDSGHKIAILASLISGGYVPFESITIEGITEIGKDDIAFSRELGYTVKLIGIIKRDGSGKPLDVRVHPAMFRDDHILASVSDVYNAVLLEGDAVGRILLYGKGAGEFPTASAVVSDIVDIARNIASATPVRIPMHFYRAAQTIKVKSIDAIRGRYYLRFAVEDRPGVLASIAGFLGEEGISLASVMQREGFSNNDVPVIILTHSATEKNLRTALVRIEAMSYIKDRTRLLRIEE